MQLISFVSAVLSATAVFAALNEPCYGSGGRAGKSNFPSPSSTPLNLPNILPGVCVTTSACSSSGGTTIDNACPADPANVKCCTKASCGSGGNCRHTSDCAGTTAANQCPGPSSFKCCSSSATGFGGYAAPAIPGVGACKKVAVDGAKKIVAAFPGRVRQVFCIRDCQCNVDPSDHCCGKATDMMCSDAGGAPTASGREIAEWVMKNRNALNLKYVIWGQRIWTVGKDAEKSWNSWRTQGDLDSITKNHWDHVHVSYN